MSTNTVQLRKRSDGSCHVEMENICGVLGVRHLALNLCIEQYHDCEGGGRGRYSTMKEVDGAVDLERVLLFFQWAQKYFDWDLKSLIRQLKKHSRSGRRLSRAVRYELAYCQQYRCATCEVLLPPNFEVDHIVELCDGGLDVAENLQCLCANCHSKKTRLARLARDQMFHTYSKHRLAEKAIDTTWCKETQKQPKQQSVKASFDVNTAHVHQVKGDNVFCSFFRRTQTKCTTAPLISFDIDKTDGHNNKNIDGKLLAT
tara:strand:+ start:2294 stop:3067 length:774 start_codon:yes stop_codon:yes gene_type:complete